MKKCEIVSSTRTLEKKGTIVIGPHANGKQFDYAPGDTLTGIAWKKEYFSLLIKCTPNAKRNFDFGRIAANRCIACPQIPLVFNIARPKLIPNGGEVRKAAEALCTRGLGIQNCGCEVLAFQGSAGPENAWGGGSGSRNETPDASDSSRRSGAARAAAKDDLSRNIFRLFIVLSNLRHSSSID